MRKSDAKSAILGEVTGRCQTYEENIDGLFVRKWENDTIILNESELVIPSGAWMEGDRQTPELMYVTSVTTGKSGWVPSILIRKF